MCLSNQKSSYLKRFLGTTDLKLPENIYSFFFFRPQNGSYMIPYYISNQILPFSPASAGFFSLSSSISAIMAFFQFLKSIKFSFSTACIHTLSCLEHSPTHFQTHTCTPQSGSPHCFYNHFLVFSLNITPFRPMVPNLFETRGWPFYDNPMPNDLRWN